MNDKTIVALYDDIDSARQVLADLASAGLRTGFSMMGGAGAGIGELDAGTDRDAIAAFRDPARRVVALTRLGVPDDDAQAYAEGVRRGGVLLVGRVADARCREALDIIERHGSIDLDERIHRYRAAGWTGYNAASTDFRADEIAAERRRHVSGGTATAGAGTGGTGAAAAALGNANRTGAAPKTTAGTTAGRPGTDTGRVREGMAGHEERIPVASEELHVGKREVAGGHVRVRSYMVETPVEEQVRLRDESVTVERRTVDRPAGDIPADAFRERTVDVTERHEEPVVSKEARVREEVVIRKDAAEHTETVSDTVRRTEVEIEDDRNQTPVPRDGRTGR